MSQPTMLFLDFDGVLHSLGEAAMDEDFRLIANPNLFCWRSILVGILAPHPSVKIIVSSDWRRLVDDECLVRLLGESLGARFVGVVEVAKESRADEILAEALRRELRCWLAVDDHPSVAKARKAGDTRFIACAPDKGLSDPTVQRELKRKLAAIGFVVARK